MMASIFIYFFNNKIHVTSGGQLLVHRVFEGVSVRTVTVNCSCNEIQSNFVAGNSSILMICFLKYKSSLKYIP